MPWDCAGSPSEIIVLYDLKDHLPKTKKECSYKWIGLIWGSLCQGPMLLFWMAQELLDVVPLLKVA